MREAHTHKHTRSMTITISTTKKRKAIIKAVKKKKSIAYELVRTILGRRANLWPHQNI